MMDMELAVPMDLFRTYMDVDTREFKTFHYVEAPLLTFSPPEEWNLSPSSFRGMISLDPSRFYDTESAARPRSYVMVPSELETNDARLLGLSMFEYATDVLYMCHPARSTIPAQIRAMNVRDSDICVVSMPSPNCSGDMPLTTLFHEVVVEMRYQRHLDTQDHLNTSSWFDSLPEAVQLYLGPLQNRWLTEWLPALNGYPSTIGTCERCNVRDHNLRRHHMRHHAPMRAVYFCPMEGCPSVLIDQQGLRDHLRQNTHRGGAATRVQISAFAEQNCFWPLTRAWTGAILGSSQKFHAYIMLHAYAGVALLRTFYAAKNSVISNSLMEVLSCIRPRFSDPAYSYRIVEEVEDCEVSAAEVPVHISPVPDVTRVSPVPACHFPVPPRGRGRAVEYLRLFQQNHTVLTEAVQAMSSSRGRRLLQDASASTTVARTQAVAEIVADLEDGQIQRTSLADVHPENFEDAESDDPAPVSPVRSVTPDECSTRECDIVHVALASVDSSPEGAVGPSVAFSLPGGVEDDDDSSWMDTTCPVQPEGSDGVIPEAPEGSPSSEDILVVSPGASASPFPGEQRVEVPDSRSWAPAITCMMSHLDDLDQVAAHQQQMLDRAAYDRWVMRRSIKSLAEFAGVPVGESVLGCQCPGKH